MYDCDYFYDIWGRKEQYFMDSGIDIGMGMGIGLGCQQVRVYWYMVSMVYIVLYLFC